MTNPKGNYAVVLKKAARDTTLKLDKALQATAVETIGRLVDRTPVDTGAAKFHWFVRAQPDEVFDKARTDPSGQQPKQRAKRDVKIFRIGWMLWLVNSAPYMTYLERGSSKQAPAGVVAITLAEVPLLWRRQVDASWGHAAKAL
jgi:hypothetical protein